MKNLLTIALMVLIIFAAESKQVFLAVQNFSHQLINLN